METNDDHSSWELEDKKKKVSINQTLIIHVNNKYKQGSYYDKWYALKGQL